MEYDSERVDEMTLALLYLTMFPDGPGMRAWKGVDWDTLSRLHEKGCISDPKSAAKSLIISEEGVKRSEELFRKYFGKAA